MSGIQPSGGVGPNATQNTIANPVLAAGCDNLWYAARCNPRLDPFAMNAMIAEIINAVNGCGCASGGTFTGLAYDCNRLDNLCRAIRNHITEYLFDCCLPRNFPDVGDACTIEQLVLTTDASGCRKIARYTDAAATLAFVTTASAWPLGTNLQFPVDPTNRASYYNRVSIIDDQDANTINEAMLAQAILFEATFNVACDDTRIEFNGRHGVLLQPQAGTPAGSGARGAFVPRVDGQFIKQPAGTAVQLGSATNFQDNADFTTGPSTIVLDAGPHTIQIYWMAPNGGVDIAQIGIQALATTASGSVRMLIARS